jgi:hypothetical protein
MGLTTGGAVATELAMGMVAGFTALVKALEAGTVL